MIIEIPNENSIVKWKNDDKDEWKVAEISDLIKVYEHAPTVEARDNFDLYVKGLEDAKSDIITLIANEYTAHGELIPNWLTIGETKIADMKGKEECQT